jgi:F-type H+-transporting ATPase subunit a
MEITPDVVVWWELGPLRLSATVVCTWITMAVLTGGAALVRRRLTPGPRMTRGQNALETVVGGIREQIRSASGDDPDRYLPFVGTLFLFIATANALSVVPGFRPPTGSLSTTTALALCVFVAVPAFGVARDGVGAYLRQYLQPSPIMLPFNIIGELSRTLALAVRLFGNIMSGTLIIAVLLSVAPLFLPVVMQAFGLLVGLIQAYIFAVLALVYIASGTRAHDERRQRAGAPTPAEV